MNWERGLIRTQSGVELRKYVKCRGGEEVCEKGVSPLNSGRPSDIHSLVTVQLREDAREFTLVDIGTIRGLAHLIPGRDSRWLVNSRINLRTFNEIY